MIVNNVHQERCAAIDASYSDINPMNLSDYGVEVRYPDFLEPSNVEINELVIIVNQIREKVMTGISNKC